MEELAEEWDGFPCGMLVAQQGPGGTTVIARITGPLEEGPVFNEKSGTARASIPIQKADILWPPEVPCGVNAIVFTKTRPATEEEIEEVS